MADPQAITNPFEPAPGTSQKQVTITPDGMVNPFEPPVTITPDPPSSQWDVIDDRQIANPFEPAPASNQWDVVRTAPSPSRTNQLPNGNIVGPEKGVRGWLQSVEDDIRYGSGNTLIGKALQKLGATGVNNGAQAQAGNVMASPVLGTIKATQGLDTLGHAAEDRSPAKAWQGTKEVVGGVLDASQLPSAFIAPEAGEAAAKLGQPISDAVDAIASKVSPGRVVQKTTTSILDALDRVAQQAGIEASDAASPSGRAADMVSQLKSNAQDIYGSLDTASGGRYQRYSEEIADIKDYLNRATSRSEAAKLRVQLTGATARFNQVKQEILDAGLANPEDITRADALWKQAKALEQVGRNLKQAETLSGELKQAPGVLDNATKAIDSKKAGTLERAVGGEADTIRRAVIGNTKGVTNATKNRAVAGKVAAGGLGLAGVLKILSGTTDH